jgi:hypothetical protein
MTWCCTPTLSRMVNTGWRTLSICLGWRWVLPLLQRWPSLTLHPWPLTLSWLVCVCVCWMCYAVLCVLFSQVSIPVIDNVLNALRIEVSDVTITLSARWVKAEDTCLELCTRLVHWLDTVFMYICIIMCTASTHICFFVPSSCGERDDWFHTLSRAIADHAAGLCTFGGPCSEVMSSPLNDSVQDIPLKLTCITFYVWNVWNANKVNVIVTLLLCYCNLVVALS